MLITCQPRWDKELQLLVLAHIKFNDAWSDDLYPLGGVHIQPKPIQCKIDVIEINILTALLFEDGLRGTININVFHKNTDRISELKRCVGLIMDESYLEGFLFNVDFSRLYKQPQGRWLGNTRYNYSMSITEFKNRYGNKS